MRIGSLVFKPKFWLAFPSVLVALLLFRASTLRYSEVVIPPNAISLQRQVGELHDVYTQTILEKDRSFAESPLFFLGAVAVTAFAGYRFVTGIEKVSEGTEKSTPPRAEVSKKVQGTTPSTPSKSLPSRPEKPHLPSAVAPQALELTSKSPKREPEQLATLPVPMESLFDEADDFLSLPVNPSGVWTAPTFEGFQLPEVDSDEWIERFIRQRHVRIAGLPGSGKSFLSIRLLQEDLKAGARIAICDQHYLKPLRSRKTGEILLNEDGTPKLSDWNGFPRESIFCTLADISQTIAEFRKELEERKRICRTCKAGDPALKRVVEPWFLYFDEIDITLTDFKSSGNTKVLEDLASLISEGDGFSIGVRLIGQSLACGQSQINEAMNGQLCVVMLGRTAMNGTEVGKLKLTKPESEGLITEVRNLNAQGKWGAIVQFKTDPAEAVSVPDLSELNQYRFDQETSPCPDASIPTASADEKLTESQNNQSVLLNQGVVAV